MFPLTGSPASPMTPPKPAAGLSPGLTLAFATACGVTIANLYYAQPLIGPVGQSLALGVELSALVVTTLQLGYVTGLIFIAPLGDLFESRRLILLTLGGVVLACALAAAAPVATIFMLACFLTGLSATATQVIIPLVAHLSPERIRGRTVGTVMSGLLVGILLARPVSTLIAGYFGWRAVFVMSAAATACLIGLLALVLPTHKPEAKLRYFALVRSLWPLLRDTRVLQRRAFYQACMFGAFSLYWSAIPLALREPPFSLGPVALSLFLLSGAAGAFVTPIAGRLADHGYGAHTTTIAMLLAAIAFVLVYLSVGGTIRILVVAGIVLDAGVQANIVIGQRAIYALAAPVRSRLNALYLATIFCGGAVGSSIAGWVFATGGVPLIGAVGLLFPLAAAIVFATEFRRKRT